MSEFNRIEALVDEALGHEAFEEVKNRENLRLTLRMFFRLPTIKAKRSESEALTYDDLTVPDMINLSGLKNGLRELTKETYASEALVLIELWFSRLHDCYLDVEMRVLTTPWGRISY